MTIGFRMRYNHINQVIAMENPERAQEAFGSGLNCAQSIVSTYAEKYGISSSDALRISAGFGSGMAGLGMTCGTVSGAVMVLGLRYGMEDVPETQRRQKTYAAVREFTEKFQERNGSLLCSELLKQGDGRSRCAMLVKDSAEILDEILDKK